MTDVCVCTVVTRSHAPLARVLVDSLVKHRPDVDVLVGVLDGTEADVPGTRWLSPDELFGPHTSELMWRYHRHQLVVSGKAFAMRAALDRGYRRVVFLDADILVTGPLSALVDEPMGSIMLTPHLVAPAPSGSGGRAHDLLVVRSGSINGGCIAVQDDDDGRAFVEWFQERLREACAHDVARGLHFDQTWLDLVPGMFGGVRLLRHPGYNVAWWNLHERLLRREGPGWIADDHALQFFHFSGYDPRRPDRPSGYVPGLRRDELGGGSGLFDEYDAYLAAHGAVHALAEHQYAWDSLDDGTAISAELRAMLTREPHLVSSLDLRSATGADLASVLGDVWYRVWELRQDLQRAYPDPRGEDQEGFAGWVTNSAPSEHPSLADLASAAGLANSDDQLVPQA